MNNDNANVMCLKATWWLQTVSFKNANNGNMCRREGIMNKKDKVTSGV